MKNIIEIFGWYGTIAIISAYFLVSFSYIESTSISYQLLNLTGALGIVTISFYKKAYQPGVLNAIWAFIASVAIINIILI